MTPIFLTNSQAQAAGGKPSYGTSPAKSVAGKNPALKSRFNIYSNMISGVLGLEVLANLKKKNKSKCIRHLLLKNQKAS